MPHSGLHAVIFVLRSYYSISCSVLPLALTYTGIWGWGDEWGHRPQKVPKYMPFISEEAETNGLLISVLPPSLSASQEMHSNFDCKLQGFYFPRVTTDVCLAS